MVSGKRIAIFIDGANLNLGQARYAASKKGYKMDPAKLIDRLTSKDEFKNLKQMEEALQYWESKDLEDFPIDVKRNKEVMRVQPITEMI